MPALAVVITLGVIGGAVSAYKLSLVGDIRHVGHADEAAYAEIGRSLAAGRGFNVRHVSVFFVPYDPGIERREDHWPPLMGMLIAPWVWWYGVEAWAAKMPAILMGSVGLPLAAAGLAMALSRQAWPGLLAGLCMLADVTVFTESLKTLTDVTTAAVAAGWLAAVIAAGRWRWMHIVAGVLAAAAFYGKGSQIVLLALWPVAALLVEGWRVFARRWLYLGGGAAVALMSPWLIANWIEYGRPLHSTQNFAAGYIGLDSWEERFYRPHWGRDLPHVSDRWTLDAERYASLVARQRESFARVALLGQRAPASQWHDMGRVGAAVHAWLKPEAESPRRHRRDEVAKAPAWRPGQWRDPVATWCGLAAVAMVAGVACIAVGRGAWRGVRRRRGQLQREAVDAKTPPRDWAGVGGVAAVVVVGAAQWAFVVYLWEALPRLGLVFLPMAAGLAATGVARLAAWPMRAWPRRWSAWRDRAGVMVTAGLCVAAVVLTWAYADELKAYQREEANLRAYPYVDQPMYAELGDWLRGLPEAERPRVIMCRNPWQFRFASPDEMKMVGLPYAEPGVILWIARYYGVTHLLRDKDRPGMWRYFDGRHPAFVQVPGAPHELYRIDWSKLPPDALVPPHDGATLP